MRRIIGGAVVLVAGALVVLAIVASRPIPSVHAVSCSNSVLSGNYGAHFSGQEDSGNVTGVEAWYFDGVGNLILNDWEMTPTGEQTFNLDGTYSLTGLSDGGCQGTFSLSNGRTYQAVTANSGSEAYAIDTGSGGNIVMVLKKQ